MLFECFNTEKEKKGGNEERGYGSGGGQARGRVGWGMGGLVVLGLVGALAGSL